MIATEQVTLQEIQDFRRIHIEADANSVIMRLGDYTVHVNRQDLAAYCLCPSGTLNDTADEPLVFKPGEEHGSRKPCKHILDAWELAPLLWGLGERQRISQEPALWTAKEIKRAIAKGIENAVQVARERSIMAYLDGRREFSTDLIADLIVPEATTQRWKAAVAKDLSSSGFWTKTERSIARGAGTRSLIRVYLAGPLLVSMCDDIERRRASE